MTVSTPRSDSGTPRPKKKFVSVFVPFATFINDWTASISMPKRLYHTRTSPSGGWADSPFKYSSWRWLQRKARDLLVWADLLRCIWWRRSKGQTHRPTPPFGYYIYMYIYIYIYNKVCSTSLVVALIHIPMIYTVAKFGVVRQIWQTHQTIIFSNFSHGLSLSISHLPHGSL
jgi:hypothetical protein